MELAATELAVSKGFSLETIDVAMVYGMVRVTAYRLGTFGIHEHLHAIGLWRITHLPSALCLAHSFPTKEAAAKATDEISRLRNDWAVLADQSEYSPEFKDTFKAIVRAHGGIVGVRGGQEQAPHLPAFNGYKPEIQ